MKRTLFIIPVFLIILAAGINHFSCSKDKNGALLGNSGESPIRKEMESAKAAEIQTAFRKIFNLYKDSVVYITTEQIVKIKHPFFDDPILREFFGNGRREPQTQKRTGLGTGFIISDDGYICTNHHVINGVDKVNITIKDKVYEAVVIGSDERTDIGLLKIDTKEKLNPVYFGDSDIVEVGDWAIAIGNPFGLDKTFTVGVVSAIGRRDVDFMGGSHIQTDASINPGNSGGPLINIYGEVIGINRMIYSKSGGYMGIGFAIPMNTAKSVLVQLKKFQKVKRGYLGVSILPISEDDAKQIGLEKNEGAFIAEVIDKSPAALAGVRVGDVIVRINSTNIKDTKDLLSVVGETQAGETITITVWRNKQLITLKARIKERPGN